LSAELTVPLNLEMAATDEMLAIALRHRPHAACIVPEKREERTTEGGLDAAGLHNHLAPMVRELRENGSRVSLFIEPDRAPDRGRAQPWRAGRRASHRPLLRAGRGRARAVELKRIADAAALAAKNGIEPHAGHGLTFDNVAPIAAIPQMHGAEHRPFPDRRGDLRRARPGAPPYARADGCGTVRVER
jgi:pyridoxine 5-phosphate synthase